jgi:hypothetical protein
MTTGTFATPFFLGTGIFFLMTQFPSVMKEAGATAF